MARRGLASLQAPRHKMALVGEATNGHEAAAPALVTDAVRQVVTDVRSNQASRGPVRVLRPRMLVLGRSWDRIHGLPGTAVPTASPA